MQLRAILRDFYVDDFLTSVDIMEKATTIREKIDVLHSDYNSENGSQTNFQLSKILREVYICLPNW